MRINQEVGSIYDTLTFLSIYAKENTHVLLNSDIPPNYQVWKEIIIKKINVPHFSNLFFYPSKDTNSFLHQVFFDRAYNDCTFERLRLVLNNRHHMKKRFIAYYFPDADEPSLNKLLKMNSPDVIDTLICRSLDCSQAAYFFYTLINFESVLQTLVDVVMKVYAQVDILRRSVLPVTYEKALKQEAVFLKLKSITDAPAANESDFTVSLSLLEADLISFHTYERDFILLGYDFEKRLEVDYKYCDVTLYSFAQAIGNPAKHDIYNALLAQSPLTSAELSMRLNLSRHTLDYNLNDMVKSRLILSIPINKRTNNYSINNEYLKHISRLLNVTLAARFE